VSGQIDIKQSLKKAYRKQRPTRAEIELLRHELVKLLEEANPKESEEYHKGLLKDFLKKTAYTDYFINTKDRSDLVIHNGKNSKSSVGVIIETKRPSNKAEMPTNDNLNKKGMQELLLYFLRERITQKNFEIKHLAITNFYKWFIFDAIEFEKIAEDPELKKHFKEFEEGSLTFDKTEYFYKEIAAPVIEQVKHKIKYVHININNYENHLRKKTQVGDRKLIELQKIFSPIHLLKLPFANDSNTLNKNFYSELLHIIGLEEYKEKGKKLIRRKEPQNRDEDSLIEAVITQITSLDKLSRIEDIEKFGDNKDEQLFNIGLELVITWINRILFLKLLESQIVSYHNNRDYLFLNKEKVSEYNDLNTLFFQVLAVEKKNRTKAIQGKFPNVPYLNSSLFDPTELEHQIIFISNLPDDTSLTLYKKTVLNNKKEKMITLEYLFRFLDAYDFSSEGKEDIADENKTLINASVLGLIYEKINGYKDGSFFTPGFITMYMCRETIRRAVVQKLKEQTDFASDDYGDLVNFTNGTYKKAELEKYNEIINSLKICDPAVGSGHFLVSALNEIIAIKAELGILIDDSNKPLRDYLFDVENDELMILDNNGEFFRYEPQNTESQRVQKTLFHEKQTIIENCLFGVDINPNSVKICQLRLWIELLKNAYYKEDGELETLPNIDINIKCGNSLISRYPIDANLGHALVGSTWDIVTYRLAVMNYRNAENKEQKREAEKLIEKIKIDFHTGITEYDSIWKKREKIRKELNDLTIQGRLYEQDSFKKDKKIINRIKKLAKDNEELNAQINEIKSGAVYRNAIEWRFEFPEVLDEKTANFTGFDIVIGNPPYGRYLEIEDNVKKNLRDRKLYGRTGDIAESFILLISQGILANKYLFSFIVPKGLSYVKSWKDGRKLLLDKLNLSHAIDVSRAFDEAAYEMMIFISSDKKCQNVYAGKLTNEFFSCEKISKKLYDKDVLFFGFPEKSIKIAEKIVSTCQAVSKYYNCWYGIGGMTPRINRNQLGVKVLTGKEIQRFFIKEIDDKWFIEENIIPKHELQKNKVPKVVAQDIVAHITKPKPHIKLTATIDYEGQFCFNTVMCFSEKSGLSNSLLLGIINSKFMSFYYYYFVFNQAIRTMHFMPGYADVLPIPKNIDETTQKKIERLVDKILAVRKKDPKADTSELETEIDQMVYKLYGLTPDEIAIVETHV